MWEKIKTGVLLGLILLSFGLTSMFWLGAGAKPALVVSTSLPDGETTPASYLDLYAPLHIYVHTGGNHYQLRALDSKYTQVWQMVKSALTSVAGASQGEQLASSSLAVWQQAARTSLELRYSGQVELNYWWLAASKTTILTLSPDQEQLFFDRILIPWDDNVIYFRNLQSGEVWSWRWSSNNNLALLPGIDDLTFSSSETLRAVQVPDGVSAVTQAGMYVAKRLATLPEVLAAAPYDTADKADIVRQFFSITPRVSKTEVRENGEVVESFITAKQQVLNISNTGRLGYSETVSQAGANWATVNEQFEQAFNFISTHGGWPKSVIADGITQVGSTGYQFDFVQLYDGYPLVDSASSTLSVQVAPDGIQHYLRKTYEVLQRGYFRYAVRSAEDALQAISGDLGSRKVTDIYLGYYQRDFVAIDSEQPFETDAMYIFPVWVVELDSGQSLYVHAFNLMNDPGVIRPE